MARYSSPPLFELSIALQFGASLPLTPNKAVRVFEELSANYPELSIREPIGKLGAPAVTLFKSGDELAPRYWFSSADGYLLVQLQNDLVAFNWRKRSDLGEPATTAYPGFEYMAKEHQRLARLVLDVIDVSDVPPPSGINLFYDNVWLRESGKSLDDYFAFWRRLGLQTAGPVVQFSVGKFEGALGEAARIDVTAQTGGVEINGKGQGVCRLALSALDYPAAHEDVEPALHNVHKQVTRIFEAVTTTAAQESWK